jgi:peptidoglycan L-alanyl-D-glutamate endopeptidase CwlK
MPEFSSTSISRIRTLHPQLQRLTYEVIKIYDFSVLCGFRNKDNQKAAFESGNSLVKYPKSKHNQLPSLAVDVAPYPIDWDDINEFFFLAGLFMMKANQLSIPLRWGGRWVKLKDLGHFELML